MNPYTIWFVIFGVLGYFIVTDNSVAQAFLFVIRLLQFQYEKYKWIAIYHPATPWARYSMWRRSNKLAKELMKEFEDKNNV